MRDPYQELANAVVLQAVHDYRQARKKLEEETEDRKAKLTIKDCERFFHSGWFAALTSIDGQMLLEKLKEEEVS